MDTQLAFAFGMLAMIAITMMVVLVVGMVKVFRITKQIRSIEQELSNIHVELSNTRRDIYNEIADNCKDLTRRADDAYTNARNICNGYTDARIDKLEQKLTETKKPILKD
jgi:ribosome recycling factor